MSQNNNLTPYYQSGEVGVDHRNIGKSGSDHPFGDEPKEWEADLRPLIRQVADDLYESWSATVREYLANAETACLKVQHFLDNPDESPFDDMIVDESYEPRIIVKWDKSEQKLIIKDNGIGMAATEVDQVFRHIGRSAARDLGTMSGAFGMGALSFPKFIGPDNTMVMLSHSRLNDDNAAYLVTLAGVEPVMGSLEETEYGTSFTLDQKEKDMEIRSAVRKYSEWMRVPVLYREIDENGKEVFNEDWGDKRLYDGYDKGKYCESLVVPGGFEAYSCESSRNKTLLLSMDIDRNTNVNHEPPYPFDIRILDESGKVIKSSNGNEGLIPVSRMEYEQMLLTERSDFITYDLLSNQDVVGSKIVSGTNEGSTVVEDTVLDSDQPLPVGDYIAESELANDDCPGDEYVIIGSHQGRAVLDEESWNDLPQGRAENFIPDDELEEYDVDSGTGDLCLPKPTTDRSSLQSNEKFWKYIANYFVNQFDKSIEEWRRELRESTDSMKRIDEMSPKNVSNVVENNNA